MAVQPLVGPLGTLAFGRSTLRQDLSTSVFSTGRVRPHRTPPLGRTRVTEQAGQAPGWFQEGMATHTQGVGVLGPQGAREEGVSLAWPHELGPPREQVNQQSPGRPKALRADVPGGHLHPLRPGPLPIHTMSPSTFTNVLSTGLGLWGSLTP